MDTEQLLGAVDIVEAFTSLRHELKLQVRSGRELQQAIDQRLQMLESQWSAQAAGVRKAASTEKSFSETDVAASWQEARQLAEAIAEIEEHLQRAVEMLRVPAEANAALNSPQNSPLKELVDQILEEFDRAVAEAGWLSKLFARPLLQRLRSLIESSHATLSTSLDEADVSDPIGQRLETSHRGLELLLERVRRLMLASKLERRDVAGLPFDAESMRAIDVVVSSDVPSTHVAEQLRPLYLWQGQVLKFADVRLAK